MMTAEAMEARRAYKRNWAKNNRDKIRAAEERYWQRIADQAAADREEAEAEQAAAE